MRPLITSATPDDAPAIAAIRNAAADDLTARYGRGHWSQLVTADSVARTIARARVLVARVGDSPAGTLCLTPRKPWAMNPAPFQKVRRPLYLTDMAVHPAAQRRGLGRELLVRAQETAREWPAECIRLDAYDAPAGAGDFYARCGWREVGRATYRGTPLIYYEWMG